MLNFLKGFVYAFNGIVVFFKHERNGKVQLITAVIVVVMSYLLHLSKFEWLIILLCIALVLALEMMNSAVEKLCDLVQPNYHPSVKIIKDIAAAAVLWVAVFAAIIGCIIFLPKLISLV